MKREINSEAQRLYALRGLLGSDGPHVVFIKRNGDVFDIVEHNYSPRRKTYKRFTLASLDEYVRRGTGVVIIDDFNEGPEAPNNA